MAELGIVFSPLLQVFFERVASREFLDIFRGQKLDQARLNQLKIALISVNAVYEDADEKQGANPRVKEWLDELKDAIYDAEDILDEIDAEDMCCKLDDEFHTTASQVRKAFSNSLQVSFVKKIERKIKEVLSKLEHLASQKCIIGLSEGGQAGSPYERSPTSSVVEESNICGREDDKQKIINFLFSDDISGNKLFVIAIVGMGGLGKTTLAQLVYNDERVKKYFDLKAWTCVSTVFDIVKVTKAILEGVGSSDNSDGKTLDWLQIKLKESLAEKKFLIVLDDVWTHERNNWEVLSNPFWFGAQGSRVLITTREERLARFMAAAVTYNLKPLPEQECWSLFVRHEFRDNISAMQPDLEVIGRQILEKCKGLPLAVKTIGAVLRSNVGVDAWKAILMSEFWDMGDTGIIPALRLSYKYLPIHLKRCFAYCSIFPKGYFFNKDELVLLWMAEGLLQKSNYKVTGPVGDHYFFDLVSRSLFQQSSVNDSEFGMHDLVNDLAKSLSGRFVLRLGSDVASGHLFWFKVRHLSLLGENSLRDIPQFPYRVHRRFPEIANKVRTFLPIDGAVWNGVVTREFLHDFFPKFRFLRVLSLRSNTNLAKLPDSIGKFRHLRYLDLSGTPIRKLPDSVCKLCNLQTLKLMYCGNLAVLPRDMHKLVSLQHLVLLGTAITEMPLHLGRLKGLRTLDEFVVNKNCGSSIGELGKFEDIGGKLSITELQNVKSPTDALDARLKDREHLEDLTLKWDDTTSNIPESQITVLENLQPHTNLKSLCIYNYGGRSFPDWTAHHSFSKIEFIYLSNCKCCHILPSFGQLHSLQWLHITGFHAIARVGMEFYGSGSSTFKPFEALRYLKFEDMPDWESWFCFNSENMGEAFSLLERLEIVRCPKLTGGLPIHFPSLANLVIDECSQLVASLPRSPTLRQLKLTNFNVILLNELPSGLQKVALKGCAALLSLPKGMMDSSSALQELEIDGCCSLKLLSEDGLPSTLESLKISNCKKLEFPMHFNYSSLKELYLQNSCDSLRCLPVNLIVEIDIFTIKGCENLESLIDSEQHENDSATSIIRIQNCPNFVSFPNGGLRAQNLKIFEIHDCGSLRSSPDKMYTFLPFLESLSISKCPMLQSFGEGGLPTNLKSISIEDCDKLVACRTTWDLQKLLSLQELSIHGKCEDVESFPEPALLPIIMTSLTISGFSNLTSLDKNGLQDLICLEALHIDELPRMTSLDNLGVQHLTSLKMIKICHCPNLKFLPKEGWFPRPSSTLEINGCPLLEKHLQNKEGKEWLQVAGVSHIRINNELI